MLKCEFCGARVDQLEQVTDSFEEAVYNVCSKCATALNNGVCRRCGDPVSMALYKGTCTSCAQILMAEEEARKNAAANSLGTGENRISFGVSFSNRDFEDAILKNSAYKIDTVNLQNNEFAKSKVAQAIWFIVKARAEALYSGKERVYSDELIAAAMPEMQDIIKENLRSFIGRDAHCRIFLLDPSNPKSRRELMEELIDTSVIASGTRVFVIKDDEALWKAST